MEFPSDYRQAFPETGDLVSDMVQNELDRLNPGGWAGTWRPSDAEERIAGGQVIVMVYVMPGVVIDDVFRYSTVNLVATSNSYATSAKVMQFLEDELIRKFGEQGFVDRPGGGKTRVYGFGIDETQQQIIFENPDRRAFEETFRLGTRKITP